ncbi:helix-turn-helix domain-containing protein [Aeromicrobium sp.]|uniref:helix-turn-helix domain-containing protein n=1 Tax=Aeromicrobium sp. TaxID=1871063 RepID=UPI0039E40960
MRKQPTRRVAMFLCGTDANVIKLPHMTITDTGVVPALDAALRLELARRHAGMTQPELSERLGISAGTIRRYENGHGTPKRPMLMAWAAVTGVSLEWLETGQAPDRDGRGPGGSYTPTDSNREPAD